MRVASPRDLDARLLFARDFVAQARAGANFCQMVSSYSNDETTHATCGSRGPLPMSGLIAEVQGTILGLKPNDFSEPIVVGASSTEQTIIICQLVTLPVVPTFNQVKNQMMERAFGDAQERQRRVWLNEVKHGTHVDIYLL
jgi:hypothetical protein